MKFPWTLAVAAFSCYTVIPNVSANPNYTPDRLKAIRSDFSEGSITARLKELNLPVEVRYTSSVKSHIHKYVVEGAHESEGLLGRTTMYFPVFEHYLKRYQLPDALKYLPIVESKLYHRFTSHAGAAGMWQFVPATARAMGLTVNGQVDERLNTYRSTEAAVKMLAGLHKEFKDWGLALAAYNCGPGRVRQAIRQAGRRDFWAIQRYLPRETQRYIPAFIAAAYLANYYQAHGLAPEEPNYDLMDTRALRVHERLLLSAVAKKCEMPLTTLRKLNQGYLQGIVPASEHGQILVLPASAVSTFEQHFRTDKAAMLTPPHRVRSGYVTVPGDELKTLAQLFQCTEAELMQWNALHSADITVNQALVVFLPKPGVRP